MNKTLLVFVLATLLLTSCSPGAAITLPPNNSPTTDAKVSTDSSPSAISNATTLPTQTATSSPTLTTTPTATLPGISQENFTQYAVTNLYLDGLKKAIKDLQDDYYIDGVKISPDGRYIAIAGCTKSYRFRCPNDVYGSYSFLVILDSVTARVIYNIPEKDTTISGLGFSPDSSQIVYATYPQQLKIWDIPSQTILKPIFNNPQSRTKLRMSVSPVGKNVAVISDNKLMIFEYPSGKMVPGVPADGFGPLYNANGSRLAIFSKKDGSEITVYDTSSWKQISRFQIPDKSDYGFSMDISPDGSWIVTKPSIDTPTIRLWDVNTGEQVKVLDESSDEVLSIEFSPNNQLLFISKFPLSDVIGKINILEVGTWQQLGVLDYYFGNSNLSFDSKGESMMASDSYNIWRWTLLDQKVIQSREVVVAFFAALSRRDFKTASALYQPAEDELKNLRSIGLDTSDTTKLLEQICAEKTRLCLPVLKVLPGGGFTSFNEYIVHVQFQAQDGSTFKDSYGITEFYVIVGMDKDQKMKVDFIPYNE